MNRALPLSSFTPPIPRLSEPMRELVSKLSAETPALVDRLMALMWEAIPDYAALGETQRQDVARNLARNIRHWFDCLLESRLADPAELEAFATTARRRVHEGVSLAAMLRGYLIGPNVLWTMMLDAVRDDRALADELLFEISPSLLTFFDGPATATSVAFLEEQHQQQRWRDRLRHRVGVIVFHTPENTKEFLQDTRALGLDPSARYTALVLRLREEPDSSRAAASRLEPILTSLTRVLGLQRDDVLHTTHNGHLVLWLSLQHNEAVIDSELRVAERMRGLDLADRAATPLGYGLPAMGALGWKESAEQAIKAIDLGLRLGLEGPFYRYSDVVLDDAILTTDGAITFCSAVIQRLASEASLLETLRTYLQLGRHRKAVAGALGIHPNTLDYRLNQIENLLGASLADASWQAKLNAALRLQQISLQPNPGGK